LSRFLLAVAQLKPARLDKQSNLQRIEGAMQHARTSGAQAILFPELFLTGYFLGDELAGLAEPVDGPSLQRLSMLARRYSLLTVCGWPEANGRSLPYNSAAVIERDGSPLGHYRKTHLFGSEPDFFSPGDRLQVFGSSIGPIGVSICYDLEFPETARVLALDGAALLLTPTANMKPYAAYQAVYTRARAMENGIYVATANTVGLLDRFDFFGESSVVGPNGDILDLADADERVLVVSIDTAQTPPADTTLRYLTHRRPELYGRLSQASAFPDFRPTQLNSSRDEPT
jgi:predicted amidohydrolase